MKRKRILHILQSTHFSGAENVAIQIIKATEYLYDVAYTSPRGTIEHKLNDLNIEYLSIDKLNVRNINKIIEEYKPDIVHAHDFTASVIVSFSKFKGKIISHIHNNPPFIKKWNIKSVVYYLTSRRYHKIIGVSDSILSEYILGSKIKFKFEKIYNYVDKEKIELLSNKPIKLENDLEYDFIFIGRLVEQKNPLMFIEIINEVKKQNKHVKAAIIGKGHMEEECVGLIKKLNLSENITLLGFIDNPYYLINKCKVVIMPSKWEGFGLTAIESLVLNKPVLNSGVGGLGEIFKNEKNLICKTKLDYVKKANSLLSKDKLYDYSNIYSKYTEKDIWIKNIIKQYD